MKKYVLLLIFYISATLPTLYACSCIGIPTFCETIADADGNMRRNLIVRGTISDQMGNGVEVKIDNLIFGTLSEETIFIRSGNGADCGVFTGGFSENESYVFAFFEESMNGIYSLNICTVDYLKIENETLIGAVAPGMESLPLSELPSLENCGSGFNIFSLEYSISVFPNPTINFIHIKNTSKEAYNNTVEIEFIDVIGRNIKQHQKTEGWLAEEEWIIDVNELAAGVYYLKIINGSQDVIYKIIKQ